MGLYQYDSTEDKLNLVAGSTNFSDAPVGAIFPFGGTDIPVSFLLCDGSAVSRTDYEDLFNVIGTAFGTGDGSTTFNLPDLRGEFLRGAGTNSHSGQGNGGAVGEHQDATKLPNIYLSANATLIVTPDKNSLFNQADASTGESTGYKGVAATSAGGDHISVNLTTRPTNTSVNYIIKAKQIGVPADFLAEVGEVYQKKELAQAVEGETTVEDALGALSTNKASKVSNATNGDIATLDSNGNLVDSGVVASSVIRRVNPSTAVDCNDLTDRFTEYRVGDGDANRPTTGTEAYIIRTFKTGTTSTVYSQIAYQIAGTAIYIRRRFSDGVWSSWEKLITANDAMLKATFQYGGTNLLAGTSQNGVFNFANGTYTLAGLYSEMPNYSLLSIYAYNFFNSSTRLDGHMEIAKMGEYGHVTVITNGGEMYIRACNNGTWGAFKKVTTTTS